ncbi:nitrilase family protein [Paradesulfitobacterium aromaticivorans]
MQQNIRIGLVQMESKVNAVEDNLNKILDSAAAAVKEQVTHLCFPEMALHGYALGEARLLAEPLHSPRVREIATCAQRLNMTLLVGMAEYNDRQPSKPYLSHLIALPDGQVRSYRKTHLGHNEVEYFSAGDEFPIFMSHGVRFAVGICWDWHFPEVAGIYSLKGAEVLFAPHASPAIAGDRKELWLRYLGARAYDNSVYLGACNLCGSNGYGQQFSGGALVLGPKADLLAEAASGTPGMLTVELPSARLNRLRQPQSSSMKERFFLAERQKHLYRELLELEIC